MLKITIFKEFVLIWLLRERMKCPAGQAFIAGTGAFKE
jgi:hypothetical protein